MSSIPHHDLTWYQRAQRFLNFNEVMIVAAILVCALVVRLYQLEQLMIFTYDQGRDMYVLQQMSRGDITLIGPTTGLPGVFLGPLMYYFLLPGFILSNGSPFGTVIWQMVWIVASFSFFYLLLRKSVGRWWAFIGLWWLVLVPGAIEQARAIWNPSLVVMILLPSLYSLFASKNKPWLLPISLFFYGLSLQTELAYTMFLAPLYGIWILSYLQLPLLRRQEKTAQPYDWRILLVGIAAFGLTLLPQVLFEIRHDFLITKSVLREMADTSKQVTFAEVWQQRPAQIVSSLTNSLTGGAPGGVLMLAAAGAASAFALLTLRHQRETMFWLAFVWLPPIGFLFFRGNYGYFFDYYITAHYLPIIALITIALAYASRAFKVNRLLAGVVWLVLCLIVFLRFSAIFYDVDRFEYTAATQISALQAARQLAPNQDTALEVFVPNLIPVAYQYLSEWLSRTGQAAPMAFGAIDNPSYILLYEPPISDGSRVAFDEWYKGWTGSATCSPSATYGITSLQVCQR